jgi:hypothetical protein
MFLLSETMAMDVMPDSPGSFHARWTNLLLERKENQTNNLAQNAKPSQLRQQPPHALPSIPLYNLLRPIIRLEDLVIQRIPLMRAIEEILIHPPIIPAQGRIE